MLLRQLPQLEVLRGKLIISVPDTTSTPTFVFSCQF